MPTAELKFNLPDENNEFKCSCAGQDLAFVIWDFLQIIRDHLKYGHKFETVDDAIETLRNDLYDLLDNHGINIDLLVE